MGAGLPAAERITMEAEVTSVGGGNKDDRPPIKPENCATCSVSQKYSAIKI